eukprot:COSAG03_NODE_591_length_6824_cov_463.857993_3_plen_162_part_00
MSASVAARTVTTTGPVAIAGARARVYTPLAGSLSCAYVCVASPTRARLDRPRADVAVIVLLRCRWSAADNGPPPCQPRAGLPSVPAVRLYEAGTVRPSSRIMPIIDVGARTPGPGLARWRSARGHRPCAARRAIAQPRPTDSRLQLLYSTIHTNITSGRMC